MFSLNTYSTEKGKLVAACDHSILGEKFREGKRILHLKEGFYHKEKVDLERVKKELENAKIANLAGKDLIERLLEEKIVKSDEIKKVDEIPHVQIFIIEK